MQVKMVGIFIRKFEINSCGKSLTLCQKNVDVSCVVWDAALVVPKYLGARCNDMGELLQACGQIWRPAQHVIRGVRCVCGVLWSQMLWLRLSVVVLRGEGDEYVMGC